MPSTAIIMITAVPNPISQKTSRNKARVAVSWCVKFSTATSIASFGFNTRRFQAPKPSIERKRTNLHISICP